MVFPRVGAAIIPELPRTIRQGDPFPFADTVLPSGLAGARGPTPHGTLSWYMDVSSSYVTSGTVAEGAPATSWGVATSIAGTPLVITDSANALVAGSKAMRTSTGSALFTAAGAAGFLSQDASRVNVVWRARKYNYGPSGPYVILDTTEAGTVAGYQITVYDNDADIFSQRLINVRVFDGATWILDKVFTETWGNFVPTRWNVVTVDLTSTHWEVWVNGKPTNIVEIPDQTINITFPSSATGRLAIGHGPNDYKAIELYNVSARAAAGSIRADHERLAARFLVDIMWPVDGDIQHPDPAHQYVAFPWTITLPDGRLYVNCFRGDTEVAASNTQTTEQFSSDGGKTWTPPVVIFASTSSRSEAGAWTLPMSNGEVLQVGYTWELPSGVGNQVWGRVSTDGGITWPSRSNITIGTPYFIQAGGAPVEDPLVPGKIRWTLYKFEQSDPGWSLVDYVSLDYASTWAEVPAYDGTQVGAHQLAEPQELFHSDGELRMMVRDYSGLGSPGAGDMVMMRSLDRGDTWSSFSAEVAAANSAGESYMQASTGREFWLGRPNGYLSLALYYRPADSAWDDAWLPTGRALYVDSRFPTEMVYGTILEPTPGRLLFVWGTFVGNNPNTIADVVAMYFDEWVAGAQMPGAVSPSAPTVTALGTQQFSVTGAGDFTWSISPNNSGGSIDSNGLYTAGSANGDDTIIATDLNGHAVTPATVTVTGGSSGVTVTSVVPDYGLDTGGQSVTIHGTAFDGVSAVTIGGTSATITGSTSTTVTVTIPGHIPVHNATVSVTATAGTGTADIFTYLPSGMTLFLIGDVVTTSGPDVTAWPDQSGNGNDATPPSFNLAMSTIGGLPAVLSIGGGDTLTFASFTAGLTAGDLYVIGQHSADDGTSQSPFEFTDDSGPPRIPLSDRKIYDNTLSTTQQATNFAPPAGAYAQPWLYNVYGDNSQWAAWFNDMTTPIFTQGSNTFGYGTRKLFGAVGANYAGKLALVLLYPNGLSGGDRNVVTAWAKQRWSVV